MNYCQPKQDATSRLGTEYNENQAVGGGQSPMLFQQIARLEKSIYALRESLGQLGERLLPITVAAPQVGEDKLASANTRATSPIVDRLVQFEENIYDLHRRVIHQMENMDL